MGNLLAVAKPDVKRDGGVMASMGKRSLTTKAWKTQGCFASQVQFSDRNAKRTTKGRNSGALRREGKKEIARQERQAKN